MDSRWLYGFPNSHSPVHYGRILACSRRCCAIRLLTITRHQRTDPFTNPLKLNNFLGLRLANLLSYWVFILLLSFIKCD